MKVRIKGLGPIEEGELEFADKAVVVGGNASGKTLLARLIYSIIAGEPVDAEVECNCAEYSPAVYIGVERAALALGFAKPDFAKYMAPGIYKGPVDGLEYVVKDNGEVEARWRGRPTSSFGLLQLAPVVAVAESPAVRTVVVEEPELDLHVDLQIAVAKYLAGLNKRLFVTTHSEWIAMYMAKARAKVYEIVDGRVEERTADEGHLEALKTIYTHTLRALERDLLS